MAGTHRFASVSCQPQRRNDCGEEMDGPMLFIANSPFDGTPIHDNNPLADQLERIYRSSASDGAPHGPD